MTALHQLERSLCYWADLAAADIRAGKDADHALQRAEQLATIVLGLRALAPSPSHSDGKEERS